MKKNSIIRNEWFIDKVTELNAKGISKADIAQKLGVKPQYLTPILNRTRNVSENLIIRFCQKYDINHNDLLEKISASFDLMTSEKISLHDKEVAEGKWHTGSVSQHIADSDEYQSLYNKYIAAVQELESKNNASALEDKKNNDDKFSLNTLLKAINNLSEAALINANANLESAKASMKSAEAAIINAEANNRQSKNIEKMLNMLSGEDCFLEKKELCQEI